jgi:signal transduction histidine kinase
MRFRRQLLLGHTALLLVTLVTGVVAAIALRCSSARLEQVTRDLASDMSVIQRLRFDAEQLVATSRAFLLTGDPKSLARFDATAAHISETLAEIDRLQTDLTEEVARVERAAKAYIAAAERAAREPKPSGDPRELLPFFERTLMPMRQPFEAALSEFVRRERAVFDDAAVRARDLAERAQEIVLVTTALSILLGVALALFSMRRLSAEYSRAQAATAAAHRATAARDELVAMVSHDLRNPLATIAMGTELLAGTEDDPRRRKHVSAIASAAGRMQYLIDQLLDVAKLEHGALGLRCERSEVGAVLDTVQSLFQIRAIEAQVELAITGEPGAAIIADRERLLQILSNLVANALKFTPRGGKITVTGRGEGPLVRFEVTDTGPGIADAQLPLLFERYWQGQASQRGSLGLGLYICKQLVSAQRGEIGVRSALGAGSTFWFTLPAA